jgi:nucleoside-diphosphate-sugar epimerase
MANSKIVAITGANGFLGSALLDHFTRGGWSVIALVRNADDHQSSQLVTYREYNLERPITPGLLDGAHYLVHTAYIKQDSKHPKAFKQNVDAAKALISASHASNLRGNVFISSMSAHHEAISSYGRQKLAIEQLFDGPKDVNLRPGLIVGNGGIVKVMTNFMRTLHIVRLISGGVQPVQFIAVRDLAQAVEKALVTRISGTLTIANNKVYSYADFYQSIANHYNIRVYFVPMPFGLLRAFFGLVKVLRLPLPINEDNLLGLQKLRAVDTTKDLQKLNLKPMGLDEALNG